MKKDFFDAFLAGMSAGTLLAGFAFAIIGVALSLLLDTTTRNPMSERSPVVFSWQFFWSDNFLRIIKSIVTTILVIFISLRFAKNIIGADATPFYAFGVGFGLDKAIKALKKSNGD